VPALDRFSPATSSWFDAVFDRPTAAQTDGWDAIADGNHTLIHAPTGSGKTLAAFLWAVDRIATSPTPPDRERCRVLYISPLKALAYDVDRNLRAPLTGIKAEAARLGIEVSAVSVAMRTGDTPQRERQAMVRKPPDILITTPESLFLMLTSRAREILATVETVIVDEIHSMAGTKRGSHLALSLERLDRIAARPVQRIGLSATQRPLERIAEFLGGGTQSESSWSPRPVTVVDAPAEKELDVEIIVPVRDMTRPEDEHEGDADPVNRSIWPAMYPRLLSLVEDHRSTILFVNSRGLAERLASELNRLADTEIVQAHHGSVSREQRIEIEDRLKRGALKGVVATSTLELGIDMAAVDLVVLVESPSSVASGMQRVGRAGHQVGAASMAKVFPKHRGDLLETAVVVERMREGEIEQTSVPQNPIDVLAQHIVAMVALGDREVDEVFDIARGAMPFRSLSRPTFESVLDMLAGRYPSDDFAELRPRITWDRVAGVLSARSNARLLAITNAGTIPDRGLYTVNLPDGSRVGELDEEMVYESRAGDTFVLGSTTWKIDEISHDRVVVVPNPGAPAARMPFWHGDAPGRPVELGRAVGAFTRTISLLDAEAAIETLKGRYRLDHNAATNLAAFIASERAATGTVPSDETIVVERFKDEIGDWRIVVLSPFGGRVHAPWALAIRNRYREEKGGSVDVIWSDDGIVLRFPDVDAPPDTAMVFVEPALIDDVVLAEVADTAVFTARFREAAARALLLPRRRPGSRTPLWLQRRKAANLLEATRGYGSFPIMLETYREILQDHFDVPALKDLLASVESRTVRIAEVDTDGPSPFASSLMFDFIASFMYEYDAPVAERKAAALSLDRALLAELLGEPEFRELLDPDVLEAVEDDLQHRSPDRMARSADAIHDMLNDLGPLTRDDVAERTVAALSADDALANLTADMRVFEHTHAGRSVFVAAEDLARQRDAIGIQPRPGVPSDLLAPVDDPLGDIVQRYARTHAPFTVTEAASRTGLSAAVVEEVLGRLERVGKVRSGAFRPAGEGQEWVSTDVLRRMRRRSLAVLRQQVEATDPEAFAAFLPSWHRLGDTRHLHVDELIRPLVGYPIHASSLDDILSARSESAIADVDEALTMGDLVWVGLESVGTKDGKVALLPRARASAFLGPLDESPRSEVHEAIVRHLVDVGASFFADLYAAAGGGDPQSVADAVWDLVWQGVVTNDSLAPLRAYTRRRPTPSARARNLVATPPHAVGRWYATTTLRQPKMSPEEAALIRAQTMLDRYGIVTRSAALAEGIPGGFSGLYPALQSLEDIGSVRRGYFIEGMGGAQFALPGAVDRLRLGDPADEVVIEANDPANAYGAAVAWPETHGRPERRPGALVLLARGAPTAWIDKSGARAATFGATNQVTAAALKVLTARKGNATLRTIDGVEAGDHPVAPSLFDSGFRAAYRGISLRDGVHPQVRSR